MNKIKEGTFPFYLIICPLSFLAGGVNGFLGTGGGILFVMMLSILTNKEPKEIFATTLCSTLPISLIGLIRYAKGGNIDTSLTVSLILPALLGGAVGAFIANSVKSNQLKIAFALLVIFSGVRMLF